MSVSARIRANRANAKRSTGPKTKEGKARSARNALKHGLSIPIENLSDYSENIQAIVGQIVKPGAPMEEITAALAIAEAQVDINRVRLSRVALYDDPQAREKKLTGNELERRINLKRRMLDKMCIVDKKTGALHINQDLAKLYGPLILEKNLKPVPQSLERGFGELQQALAKLWRYERRALSRRNKASKRFDALTIEQEEKGSEKSKTES